MQKELSQRDELLRTQLGNTDVKSIKTKSAAEGYDVSDVKVP